LSGARRVPARRIDPAQILSLSQRNHSTAAGSLRLIDITYCIRSPNLTL